MEGILIIGIALTAAGILVGLYLPVLASQFTVPDKVRFCAFIGMLLVVLGTVSQIVSLWPAPDSDLEQTTLD